MIEGDARHSRCDGGRDDVGCIEAPAHPNFEHRAIDVRLSKRDQGCNEREFEEGQIERKGTLEAEREQGGVDRNLIDSNAFGEAMQVGRRKQANAIASVLEGERRHGGHASFPVGACDVKHLHVPFGMAEVLGSSAHPRKTKPNSVRDSLVRASEEFRK